MSSVPDSESFRFKWQSQLASLAGETGSLGKQSANAESFGREQETAAGKSEVNDAAAEESTADKFQTAQALTTQAQAVHTQATQALLARLAEVPQDRPQQDGSQPEGPQQSAEARILTNRPGNAARSIGAVVQIGAPEPGQESTDAAIADSADSKSRQTSRTHSSAHAGKNEKAAMAAAANPTDTFAAAAMVSAPPIPLPLVPNPVSNRAGTKTIPALTDTVSTLSTEFANQSLTTTPSLRNRSAAEPPVAGPTAAATDSAAATRHGPLAGTEEAQLIAGAEPRSGSLTAESWNGTKAEAVAANLPNLSDYASNANQTIADNHENHALHTPIQEMGTGNTLDASPEAGITAAATTGSQAIAIGDIASPSAAPDQSPGQHQDASHAQFRPPETQAAATSTNGQAARQPLLTGQSPVSQPIPPPIAAGASANPSGTRPVASSMQSSSVQSVKRNARESGSLGNRSTAAQGQLTPAAGDTAAMIREAAGVRTSANPASGHAEASAEPALREAFAAMDAEAAPGAPAWLHAGARQAEAGFEDPALGWVGVRAGLDGGAVHATLVPGSDAAAQELGLHMDGLNAYMAEQHTPIESLAVAAPEARSAGHGAEQGFSQSMGQGMGQSSNQGSNPDANQGSRHNAQHVYAGTESSPALRVPGVGSSGPAVTAARSPVRTVAPSQTAPSGGGVHISVVA
jgi:hypothetical protein